MKTKMKKRVVEEMYPRPVEFLRSMKLDMYEQAHNERMSFTEFLEDQPGISSDEFDDGLDTFERLLCVAGIRVNSDEDHGMWADTCGAFLDNENTRALFPEFCGRKFRGVKAKRNRSSLYASAELTPGSAQRPYWDNLTPRTDLHISPAIPLSSLVAVTTPITGAEYRATYIVDSAGNQRKIRVGEGAPLPKAKLVSYENTVTMYKFGRSIEITYEQMRRMRIDRLAMHIQKIAVQTEVDQVEAAFDVIINGDGNSSTAAENVTITSLVAGHTLNTLSLEAWLLFRKLFKNPYMLTTGLMRSNVAVKLELLNVGSANLPMVTYAQQTPSVVAIRPINQTGDALEYGWLDSAPANKLVTWDKRFELERVVEIGSEIQEVMRWVNRQTEEMTMSMNEGYTVIDPSAARILDLTA